jgi:hypothetical protein
MRQALLRPIEITAANQTITIASTDYTITAGVYANVFHVLKAINAASAAMTAAYMSTSWRAVFALTSSGATLTQTALSDLLGFTGSETGATRTATYAPAFCWVSQHQYSMTERWIPDFDQEFHGAPAMDGNLSGVTMSTRERLRLRWPWQPAASTYPSAATLSFTGYDSAIRIPEQHSCFCSIVSGSRTAYCTAASSGNVSPKGVYYIEALDDFLGSEDATTWDSGGTNFDLASSPDGFVFCSAQTAMKDPKAAQNNLKTYYDIEVELTTAVAPTWVS